MTQKKNDIWKKIINAQRIVLTTHVRPDGDGLASELALFIILTSIGKEVFIVNQDKTPDMYAWLPHADVIHSCALDGPWEEPNIDIAILLDCTSETRVGFAYRYIKRATRILCIDHHENSNDNKNCYIDVSASSIGEMLYELIPNVEDLLDRNVATCLYTSILTDTGSFAYSNTSDTVFRIVSRLVEFGVDPAEAYRNIYCKKKITHFRLLSRALERLKTELSGRIVYCMLPGSVFKETGADEEDNEGILEVVRGLQNVELIIFVRQLDARRVKVSLRSTNHIDCNALALLYGGGGHLKASGFVVEGTIEKIGDTIVSRIVSEVAERKWL
jgi:phosphoesterase RecJ-like protein